MTIDADPVEGLLTLSDVAEILKVSVPTVRRFQQQRKIPFVKVGGSIRFARSDVASYLAARRVRAIGE
jgi:excisionase family DNA binding protein